MMRRALIIVTVLLLAPAEPRAQTRSVSLIVTDMGLKNTPIPAVNVRVLGSGGTLRDAGTTDGNGTFVTTKLVRGEVVTFEYELAGYVRRPERQSWKVVGPSDTVNGTLISRTNRTAAYLRAIADVIDAIAASAPSQTAKKLEYTNLWERVAELPPSSQQIVGRELDGKQYLVDVGSFQNATKDNSIKTVPAK